MKKIKHYKKRIISVCLVAVLLGCLIIFTDTTASDNILAANVSDEQIVDEIKATTEKTIKEEKNVADEKENDTKIVEDEKVNESESKDVAATSKDSTDQKNKSTTTSSKSSTSVKDSSSSNEKKNTSNESTSSSKNKNSSTNGSNTSSNKNSSTTGNSSSSSSTSSNKNSNTTGSNSTTTNSGSSSASTSTHKHNWVAQKKTVHYDEVGHNVQYVITEAWDETKSEPIYEMQEIAVGNQSGKEIIGDPNEYLLNNSNGDTGWHSDWKRVQTGTNTYTVHHDAVYGTKWVVDQAAYDETVTTGYKCSSCGATK